jgi:YggT family protein
VALVCTALQLYFFVIVARIVISYFPPGGEFLESARRMLVISTEWVLGPLRRTVPAVRLGGMALDLSPMIVIVGLMVLTSLLCS